MIMDYTKEKIIQRLSEPEKLVSPEEINILNSYLNGHITDLEEYAWTLQLIASSKLAELAKTMSATKAKDIEWKLTKEWQDWQIAERQISQLKRYRSDLKDRFAILTNTKRF